MNELVVSLVRAACADLYTKAEEADQACYFRGQIIYPMAHSDAMRMKREALAAFNSLAVS